MAEPIRQKRRSALIRTLWVVQVDHSIAGVWMTKGAARAAARMLRGILKAEPYVVGPYLLQVRGPRRAA